MCVKGRGLTVKKVLTLVLAAVLSLGVLAGCGSKDSGKEQEVILGAGGVWTFNPDTINIKKGEKVTLKLVNKDTTAHTLVVPKLNVKSGNVAAGKTGQVVIEGKEVGEIEFHCDIAGHQATMVGKIVVTQ